MKAIELKGWRKAFEQFHARFWGIFRRAEAREQSMKYLRGLLSGVERKNGWQMAEVVGDDTPDKTQRLLYQAKWDADAARDELQAYVTEALGDADGIGIVDETGFLKKGDKSVGVQRQYTGTAGKIENSQVGTFVAYTSKRGHTLIDRRLFMPEAWINDEARRKQAKVPDGPDGVVFQTKPEQAREMLEKAWANGVPMRWVTGDEIYGNAPRLRDAVADGGRRYVFAVSSNTPVWTTTKRPRVLAPQAHTGGRPQTRSKLAKNAPAHRTVAEVAAAWPASASRWQRLAVSQGEKGPIKYDWAAARVIERVDGLPGREAWLLVRRSISDPNELAYYLSNAETDTSLSTLARIASSRYKIEQCFEEAKGETGLDHYEVRYYHSWYRHITLSMMAQAWLAVMRSASAAQTQAQAAEPDTPTKKRPRRVRPARAFNRARGQAFVRHRPTVATPFASSATGMVSLATHETPAGSPQPLPSRPSSSH